MNGTFVEFIVLALMAIVMIVGWYLHQAWGEIEDLYGEIDDLQDKVNLLEDENAALDAVATQYKTTANYYQTIYHEAEFAAFRKAM